MILVEIVKLQVDGTHNIIYLGTNSLNMTTRVYGDLRLDYGDFDITGSSTSTGSFGRVESNTFNTTTFNSTEVTSTNLCNRNDNRFFLRCKW